MNEKRIMGGWRGIAETDYDYYYYNYKIEITWISIPAPELRSMYMYLERKEILVCQGDAPGGRSNMPNDLCNNPQLNHYIRNP